MSSDRLLHIYLNDHFAAAVAGRELAARCRSSNRVGDLGAFLLRFEAEVVEDRGTLQAIMERVGARRDPVKQGLAWVVEKLARLKLNGRITGYSDLSRLEEIEGLCLGVEGKRLLWRSLESVARTDARLSAFPFDRLERRATAQRKALEAFRLQAAARAFGA